MTFFSAAQFRASSSRAFINTEYSLVCSFGSSQVQQLASGRRIITSSYALPCRIRFFFILVVGIIGDQVDNRVCLTSTPSASVADQIFTAEPAARRFDSISVTREHR
jgi:O-antigen ligase